jgi:hypothetical protein
VRVIDHILVRWVCVLVFSVTMVLSNKALVVCVGDHGHTAIEWAHDDSGCGHGHPDAVNDGHTQIGHHCHDACTDLALPPVIAARLTKEVEPDGVGFAAVPVFFEAAWTPLTWSTVPGRSFSLDKQHDQQVTRALSCTVLLI